MGSFKFIIFLGGVFRLVHCVYHRIYVASEIVDTEGSLQVWPKQDYVFRRTSSLTSLFFERLEYLDFIDKLVSNSVQLHLAHRRFFDQYN